MEDNGDFRVLDSNGNVCPNGDCGLRAVLADQRGKVLEGEPETRIAALGEGEISLIAKPPEHVAAAGSILIIDLYNPGLVAQRKQQIAVTRRIHQSVAVGPVRQAAEMAVDVEIVKGVPRPHRIPILVEIDDAVTHDVDSAGISRKVSEGAGEAHKDQQVAI